MTRLLPVLLVLAACGPGRTTYARYPGAPAAFDRAASEPKALEIADKVFAAAGGPANWEKAKQLRWHQTITADGKVLIDAEVAWDRWNGRNWARIPQEGRDLIVAYELYGDFAIGFAQTGEKKQNFDEDTRKGYVGRARDRFNEWTCVLACHLMLFEPGAKLGYVGAANDDAGNETLDELKLTFDEPLRKPLEFRLFIDRATNLPQRIEVIDLAKNQKLAYSYKDWVTVGGLKFATARGNLAFASETVAIKDIKVSDPQDDLYIAPVGN